MLVFLQEIRIIIAALHKVFLSAGVWRNGKTDIDFPIICNSPKGIDVPSSLTSELWDSPKLYLLTSNDRTLEGAYITADSKIIELGKVTLERALFQFASCYEVFNVNLDGVHSVFLDILKHICLQEHLDQARHQLLNNHNLYFSCWCR